MKYEPKQMQETMTSQIVNFKSDDLKTNLITIFSFVILHTAFWWFFEFYSGKLYAFMMGTSFVLALAYSLDHLRPNRPNYVKVIALGAFPTMLAWLLPKYSFFAICANFLSFWTNALASGLQEVYIYLLSNVFGWAGCYIYYQYWNTIDGFEDEDDSHPKHIKIFFDNPLHLYQLLLGIIICYVLSQFFVKAKQEQILVHLNNEQTLRSLNKELEAANHKLFQTNKELKDALQEKENFILRFSHEIRNPLNSLLGNVDLCQEFAENGESKQMLREAKVSGEILLQLLNNILDTAKVSAGRLDISLHYQNIREFLERAWIVCSEIIRKKKLYGCLSLDANVPNFIEFDTHRLMQILINTVSNASKFTEHGHVKVFVEYEEGTEIRVEDMKPRHADSFDKPEESGPTLADELNEEEFNEKPLRNYETLSPLKKKFTSNREGSYIKFDQDLNERKTLLVADVTLATYHPRTLSKKVNSLIDGPKDGYLRLEVIDTGCGIKKRDLEAIFGKFSQVHEESSKRQIGTGLGLWITKEIVELMKGKIEVFSVPNHGTVLVIMFKCKSDQPTQPSSLPQTPIDLTLSMIKRVMVVEDILYNQEINCKFLQKCGVEEIAVTNNGKEALDLYIQKGEGHFDLILMDIDMPVMDGKEATKRIRQHEAENQLKPTSIVFLTAFSESKLQKELLDPHGVYKANGFLSKPTSQDIIKRTLDEQRSKIQQMRHNVLNLSHSNINSNFPEQKVLLIDDDPYNLSIVSKMVTKCGFKPLEALNGREALELYDRYWGEISLVLTDCEMPIMDGIKVTQEILAKQKRSLRGRKPEVYGLTGHVEAEYQKRCLDAGMKGVLEKPITIDEVRELLLRVNAEGLKV